MRDAALGTRFAGAAPSRPPSEAPAVPAGPFLLRNTIHDLHDLRDLDDLHVCCACPRGRRDPRVQTGSGDAYLRPFFQSETVL